MAEPQPVHAPPSHRGTTPPIATTRTAAPGQALDGQLRQVQNRASGTGLLKAPAAQTHRNQCAPTPDPSAWNMKVGRVGDSLAAPTTFSATPFDLRQPFTGDSSFVNFAEGLLGTFVATGRGRPANPAVARTTLAELVNSWIGKKIGHAHRDDLLVQGIGKQVLGKRYWKADVGLSSPGGAADTVMEQYFENTMLSMSLRAGIARALGNEWAAPERLDAASEKVRESFATLSLQADLFTGKDPDAARTHWDGQRETAQTWAFALLKNAAALWPDRKPNLEKDLKRLLHGYLGGKVDAAARAKLALAATALVHDIDTALTAPPRQPATLKQIQDGMVKVEVIYSEWVLENRKLIPDLKLGAARSAREYVQQDAWNTGCSVPVPPMPADAAADPLQPIPWEIQNWEALEPWLKRLFPKITALRKAEWKAGERKLEAAWVRENPVKRGEKRPPRPPSPEVVLPTVAQEAEVRAGIPRLMDGPRAATKEVLVDFLKSTLGSSSAAEEKLLAEYAGKLLKADSDRKHTSAQVHGSTARFLKALHQAWGKASQISFGGGSYDGHGSGKLKGEGYSVDIMLHGATDSRGFYDPDVALLFIKTMLEVARQERFHLWVLYNDASVAAAVNKAEGRQVVHFTILHGPAPFVLHFHVDLTPMAKPQPPAP